MQKIFYEKEIDLLHQLKELVSLTVDESIDYKIEDHGVRAVGSLAIKGEYISQEKRHFLENVELDVYADDQKIIDHQDFHLKVEDFHYDIIDGNLKIKIEVGVYGVEEGENRYIQLDEDPIDEIEKLSRDVETQTINEQVVAEAPEEIQDVEKLQEKIYETKEKEEKVDDDEDLGVYYLYVVLPNDTYASIARQYQVDEKMIRDYNQDLNLDAGQILIIPYAPILAQIVRIGFPSALETALYNVAMTLIVRFMNQMDSDGMNVTARSYAMQIANFSYCVGAALAQANAIMTGWRIGAKEYEECDRGTRKAVIYGLITATCFSVAFALSGRFIVHIFTDDAQMINLVVKLLIVDIFLEFGRVTNLVYGQALKTSGDAVFPVIMGAIFMYLFAVGGTYLLGIHMGLQALGAYIAMASDECARAVGMVLRWKSGKWKGKSLVEL